MNERRESLLSPREVQAVLGLSRSATYLAIRGMTHVRMGASIRVPRSSLDAYIAAHTVCPPSPDSISAVAV